MSIGQFLQSGDWKGEKHVPAILAPSSVKAGEEVDIKVVVGEEIKHPNTLEHQIKWIKVLFKPADAKFPVEIADFQFAAHGEFDVFSEPAGTVSVKLPKSGTVYAMSYCNIHGLWENSLDISVE
ncbi:putative superoxide reductase [Andreesenia angusta]|uniref:Putative superoxide reductase n=1 Tax=Andreesenia angusta TaxID=39480 RepID=A0A1S1V6N3_9FIRM|nr:class II SORL domain-containing protein [Andreesenia angusta]OHW61787.1 putative superoxide reductase [Andreesenia angusta]